MSNSTSSSTTLLGSTSTTLLSSLSSSSSSSQTSSSVTKQSITSIVTPSLSTLENSLTDNSSSTNSTVSSTTSTTNSTTDSSTRLFHSHDSSTLSSTSSESSSSLFTSSSSSEVPSSSLASSTSSLSSSSPSSSSSSSFHSHSLPKLSTDSISSSTTTISSTSSESSDSIIESSSSASPTSSSSIIPQTSSASSSIYTTATSEEDPETTFVYTQIYCLTDDSTTITTALPVSTVLEDTSTFSYSSGSTLTTDLALFASSLDGLRNSNSSSSSSNDDASSTKGTIAGSVVGSVGGVSILLFLLWFFVLRKRRLRGSNHSEKGSFTHSISSTRRLEDGFDFENTNYRDYNEKQQQERPSSFSSSSPLGYIISKFKPPSSGSSSSQGQYPPLDNHETSSQDNDFNGLGSLRSSILRGQQIPNERTPITSAMTSNNTIPTTRPRNQSPFSSSSPDSNNNNNNNNMQLRTIDTVYEETESDNSTISRPHHRLSSRNLRAAKSSRYQNAGLTNYLLQDPFSEDTVTRKPPPPPPPPARRANAYNVIDTNGGETTGVGNRLSVESNGSSLTEDTDTSSTDDSFGSIQMGDGMGHSRDENDHLNQAGFFRETV